MTRVAAAVWTVVRRASLVPPSTALPSAWRRFLLDSTSVTMAVASHRCDPEGLRGVSGHDRAVTSCGESGSIRGVVRFGCAGEGLLDSGDTDELLLETDAHAPAFVAQQLEALRLGIGEAG